MDYEKMYKEALERAREIKSKILSSHLSTESCKAVSEYIDTIIPELRESEDEKIVEGFKGLLRRLEESGGLTLNMVPIERCKAWLEKLKEQKHPDGCFTCDEYKKGYEAGRLNGFTAGYNKAMKEIERKEQKPEWSEEDEKMIDNLIRFFNEKLVILGEAENAENTVQYVSYKKVIDWLKSLKPQPKQEWSEDFDKEVENVHKRYPEVSFAKLTRIAYHFSKWANRHKDIEWSEKDEKMRINILNALTPHLVYSVGKGTYTGTSTYKYDDEIRWLKTLRPSWKPSEEQMNTLAIVIDEYYHACTKGSDDKSKTLKTLFEQLKKL